MFGPKGFGYSFRWRLGGLSKGVWMFGPKGFGCLDQRGLDVYPKVFGWFVAWLLGWLVGSFVCSLVRCLVAWLVGSLVGWFIVWLVHWLIGLAIYPSHMFLCCFMSCLMRFFVYLLPHPHITSISYCLL